MTLCKFQTRSSHLTRQSEKAPDSNCLDASSVQECRYRKGAATRTYSLKSCIGTVIDFDILAMEPMGNELKATRKEKTGCKFQVGGRGISAVVLRGEGVASAGCVFAMARRFSSSPKQVVRLLPMVSTESARALCDALRVAMYSKFERYI